MELRDSQSYYKPYDFLVVFNRLLYKKKGEVSVGAQRLKTFLIEEQKVSETFKGVADPGSGYFSFRKVCMSKRKNQDP